MRIEKKRKRDLCLPEPAGTGSGYGMRWLNALQSILNPRSSIRVTAILLIAMTLSSCGFQPRGQATIPYDNLFIETPGYSRFAIDLARAIRSGSKTRVVDSRDESEAVLKIVSEVQEKKIVALSTAGKVLEFELRYRVAYRLTDRVGTDLVAPGEIYLHRNMTYDDTEVLAKESEELLLYRDMRTAAVQQMLRRLSVAKPVA